MEKADPSVFVTSNAEGKIECSLANEKREF